MRGPVGASRTLSDACNRALNVFRFYSASRVGWSLQDPAPRHSRWLANFWDTTLEGR